MKPTAEPYSTIIHESLEEPELQTKLARELYDVAALEAQARTLIESHDQIEHEAWMDEPENNARTALFEALTAKGHLSRIFFKDAVDDVNRKTLQRLLNGWSDTLPAWEQQRRFHEIVEELTVQQVWSDIQAGRLDPDTIVATISDYPEGVGDNAAWRMGYRSLNRKGVVRTHHFECGLDGFWFRVQEQTFRSNSNDGTSQRVLESVGRFSGQVLSNQIITSRKHLPDGVIDLQRQLDAQAGEYIRYGEDYRMCDPPTPEYGELREISYRQEACVQNYTFRLADYEREVDMDFWRGRISYEDKLALLKAEREKIINEICLLEPAYAKDARGEESARYFEQAALAMAAGDDTTGMAHFESAMRAVDPMAAPVCGGDGLVEQNKGLSQEGKQAYKNAKNERKNWVWKRGICLVKECPTRPARTEVGPCSVCRNCQTIFDKGNNPKLVYKAVSFMDVLIESFREFNQKHEAEQAAKRTDKLKKAA